MSLLYVPIKKLWRNESKDKILKVKISIHWWRECKPVCVITIDFSLEILSRVKKTSTTCHSYSISWHMSKEHDILLQRHLPGQVYCCSIHKKKKKKEKESY